MQTCRHCSQHKANRARGLCWVCFYTPAIRGLYPALRRNGKPLADCVRDGGARPLPAEPTDAPPGSEAKIRVLEERARRRQQLQHPRDERLAAAAPARVGTGTYHGPAPAEDLAG